LTNMKGIGIDFGTTNSIAAVFSSETEKIRILTDKRTNLPHPSVVWYRGENIIVGREAKMNINTYAEVSGNHFERSIKRNLGKGYKASVLSEHKAAHEIAAEIFRYIRQQAADEYHVEINEAVVTIPVKFKGFARRELRKAAAAAGIHIKTFVHEPFAAVVSYCHDARRRLKELEGTNILVFDWGGGTLDITLARNEKGCITEVATGGLEDIAGDHFDEKIRKHVEAIFLSQNNLSLEILSVCHPKTKDRAKIECERAKIALSSKDKDAVKVANFLQYKNRNLDLDISIDRSEFESLVEADIQAALHQLDKVLEEANLTSSEVDLVLMIGGSSKIPRICTEMQKRFGARLINVDNADTIIAEGAAIIAEKGWQPFLSKPINIVLSDGTLYTVFQEGTVLLPQTCRKEVTMFCTDNRDGEARLIVAEQQRIGDSSSIAMKKVVNIPVNRDLRQPYFPERVYVRFQVDEDLVLAIQGHSAIERNVQRDEIFDLCFGLRVS